MAGEPWDVPVSEEGREKLIAMAEEYRAAEQQRELGIVLSRLARIMKWVGTGREGINWHDAAVSMAEQSVEILRQIDDKVSLAAALRVAAGNLVPNRHALLKEALALSIQVDDDSGQGWAYFALAKTTEEDSSTNMEHAAACFTRANCQDGLAHIDLMTGVWDHDSGRVLRAAESFEALGLDKTAEESFITADVFGRKGRTFREREALVLRALGLAEKRGAVDRQKMYLERLARIMRKARQREAAQAYLDRAAALTDGT